MCAITECNGVSFLSFDSIFHANFTILFLSFCAQFVSHSEMDTLTGHTFLIINQFNLTLYPRAHTYAFQNEKNKMHLHCIDTAFAGQPHSINCRLHFVVVLSEWTAVTVVIVASHTNGICLPIYFSLPILYTCKILSNEWNVFKFCLIFCFWKLNQSCVAYISSHYSHQRTCTQNSCSN